MRAYKCKILQINAQWAFLQRALAVNIHSINLARSNSQQNSKREQNLHLFFNIKRATNFHQKVHQKAEDLIIMRIQNNYPKTSIIAPSRIARVTQNHEIQRNNELKNKLQIQ
ncbi:hypothetical protein TTHERM_000593069 (macronuclear) [Tetrahymena thermophila SB210]|uniref:Uncharacterized protein n=1 Tax=Tetrahymena thermophila (strain SB210) TaxID=312017 RepID=W7XFH1_TETTS|nr:hypothetical protein TTHERM_000593069 [Tetrahymena thermophila SB210]EWS75573.1 hypothetical protein TTHERM_000593069 [Tetrahymena thermophila SB210]|eukprot:XP_012651873.1 hypothetical protein TTHERM_000593069 [Tetrahymena thermophila SB210]